MRPVNPYIYISAIKKKKKKKKRKKQQAWKGNNAVDEKMKNSKDSREK